MILSLRDRPILWDFTIDEINAILATRPRMGRIPGSRPDLQNVPDAPRAIVIANRANLIQRAKRMRAQGMVTQEIAKCLHVCIATAWRWTR